MSGPIQFVDYGCGHSTPVSGRGGKTDRACLFCAAGEPAPGYKRREINPSTILGHRVILDNNPHTGESHA